MNNRLLTDEELQKQLTQIAHVDAEIKISHCIIHDEWFSQDCSNCMAEAVEAETQVKVVKLSRHATLEEVKAVIQKKIDDVNDIIAEFNGMGIASAQARYEALNYGELLEAIEGLEGETDG